MASIGWSMVLWLIICARDLGGGAGVRIAMPFAGVLADAGPLVVGVAVPTPGGVGGFHEAYRIGATAFFGADNDTAVGAAIVLHAISVVPVTLLGLLFMVQDGLNLRRHQAHDAETRRDQSRRKLKCPFCGDIGDKVVDSRESREGDVIRRRRQCLNECHRRFTSYERIEEIPYMVVKKDGTRERFERSKLVAGLLKACEKRPISRPTSTTSPIAPTTPQRSARARRSPAASSARSSCRS